MFWGYRFLQSFSWDFPHLLIILTFPKLKKNFSIIAGGGTVEVKDGKLKWHESRKLLTLLLHPSVSVLGRSCDLGGSIWWETQVLLLPKVLLPCCFLTLPWAARTKDKGAFNTLSAPVTSHSPLPHPHTPPESQRQAEPAFCWGQPCGNRVASGDRTTRDPGTQACGLVLVWRWGMKQGSWGWSRVPSQGAESGDGWVGMRLGRDSRSGPIRTSGHQHPWSEVAERTQWCLRQKMSHEDLKQRHTLSRWELSFENLGLPRSWDPYKQQTPSPQGESEVQAGGYGLADISEAQWTAHTQTQSPWHGCCYQPPAVIWKQVRKEVTGANWYFRQNSPSLLPVPRVPWAHTALLSQPLSYICPTQPAIPKPPRTSETLQGQIPGCVPKGPLS